MFFFNTVQCNWMDVMAKLREKVIALEAVVSRAAADLEAAQAKINVLAKELNEQTAARAAAEQAVDVLSVTNSQMQSRIDDLLTELNAQIANGQAAFATQKKALAEQIDATREAEKRAIAAASLNVQVYELKDTIEKLRTLTNVSVPLEAKIKIK
jgi:chromosome segregation ATPase